MPIPVSYIDSTQTWVVDEHKNKVVIMASGAYQYNASHIKGNTVNQLQLSNPLNISLNNGEYSIIPAYSMNISDLGSYIDLGSYNDLFISQVFAIALPDVVDDSSLSIPTRIVGKNVYVVTQGDQQYIKKDYFYDSSVFLCGFFDVNIVAFKNSDNTYYYAITNNVDNYGYVEGNLINYAGYASRLFINSYVSENFIYTFHDGDVVDNKLLIYFNDTLIDGSSGTIFLDNQGTVPLQFSGSSFEFNQVESVTVYYLDNAAGDINANSKIMIKWNYLYNVSTGGGIFTYDWKFLT